MSEPTLLAERAMADIHALRADIQAMRPQLAQVAEWVARFDERVVGMVKTSLDHAEQIKALREADDKRRGEIADLRLELASTKAAAALPLRAVVALGGLILLTVAGLVVNQAVKPAPAPQFIVQPASAP